MPVHSIIVLAPRVFILDVVLELSPPFVFAKLWFYSSIILVSILYFVSKWLNQWSGPRGSS